MVLYTTKSMAGADDSPARSRAQMETDIITAYEGANNALNDSLGGTEVTLNVVHIGWVRALSLSLSPRDRFLLTFFFSFCVFFFVILLYCLRPFPISGVAYIAGPPPPSPRRLVPCFFVAKILEPFLTLSTRLELLHGIVSQKRRSIILFASFQCRDVLAGGFPR